MKLRVLYIIIIVVVAVSAIPLYGWISGHLAEMMGGRMMVWGLAWLGLALIVTIAGICLVLARTLRWWKRRT